MDQNQNNHYFEQLHRRYGDLTEDTMVQRMSECTMVLGELSNSSMWKIVLDDAREMIKRLDDHWQDIPPESPEFRESRIVKMASKHISDLPSRYLQELTVLQEKLKEMQSPDKIIEKDSDNG